MNRPVKAAAQQANRLIFDEDIEMDEQLVMFRGCCPFKVFIPNKPRNYGIKIWVLADSENAYCCNL